TVNGLGVGLKGSEVKLAQPGPVEVRARVAALLEPKPTPATEAIRKAPLPAKPYWDLERARIGNTRRVPVELVVNGLPVARREIEADGQMRPVEFTAKIEKSAWVAMRILPSSHTNPIWVTVGGKTVRVREGLAWCLK